MTNTLHRYGSPEGLRDDFVVFAIPTKANREGSLPKLKAFLEIAAKHGPVNMGGGGKGGFHRPSARLTPLVHWRERAAVTPAEVIEGCESPGTVAAVFDDIEKVKRLLAELRQRDLGMSINVSGLTEDARSAAEAAGLTRHSVEYSLGFPFGETDRMPDRRTLELATMCGHSMVAFGLVQKLCQLVREGRRTPTEAARCLARFCSCGVFNTARAERLLADARDGG
ncbi:MAG: hypothetical protein A3E31_16695 [Candidatus Rokubacteria bacterium RIFCSPHIGHO2_12_FULL_73_22]|nr:MAG: hypothetical protein A3D33_11600 [Candidatus Rokubacteria bacterium RIFCSPHIGHO2_02_FULL_73_26]OGL03763.1 MAG: hypothetical protein A3E31_16695 [Candidatus Rokubacteria bacterium RIFCSPHIGHO2_12_FULL_73_22]OGL28422.1 MAG: hypothetical protein A3G44_05080 [Candidatus Rokubacteria bacterium RIFCSPLOWO2_12_FULL_73_47]